MEKPKILLTDCWTRKTLSALRSLGKSGYEVYLITHTYLSPAIWSKYATKHFLFPFPEDDPVSYRIKLLNLIKSEDFSCIFPMDEASTQIILENRNEIELYTKLALSDSTSFNVANDKWETICLAKTIGIPIPKSFLPIEVSETQDAINQLGFPLILKARNGSGSRGVKRIISQKEFDKYYPKLKMKYGNPIMQECIPWRGQGVGVGILANQGISLLHFSYKRIREFPVKGGPSTLRESTHQEDIIQFSQSILKKLNWEGVAMIEFKTDPRDGIPKLMEINPRFWGSLQLAQVSGINFPEALFKLIREEKIVQPEYKVGVQCRWLIPGDIVHFISNPERLKLKPSFFHFFDSNTFYDQYDKTDPKGNLAVIICTFFSLFNIRTWIMGVFRK